MDRRTFIQTSTLTAAAIATASAAKASRPGRSRNEEIEMKNSGAFWPNGDQVLAARVRGLDLPSLHRTNRRLQRNGI